MRVTEVLGLLVVRGRARRRARSDREGVRRSRKEERRLPLPERPRRQRRRREAAAEVRRTSAEVI